VADVFAQIAVRAAQRVGTTLRRGKYTLDRILGVGAMGAVYSATHRNGMRVAVKVLHAELSNVEELRSRFLREGYIANRVQHSGLVRVLDDDVDDDGATFLVMDLLEGRTLGAEWDAAGRRLPPARVVALADAVLDVLAAIHAQGIVHRDVKPDNVFLTAEGGLKLLDLGLARLAESSLTASGQMMGTPEFCAPEQAGGRVRDVDPRTDVYSVGAMMFTLMTGAVVHEAHTPMEAMVYAATRPARPLFDVWPDAPPALANVVDIAVAFDMDRRWRNADAMRTALGNALSMFAARDSTSSRPPASAPASTPGPSATMLLGSMPAETTDPAIPLVRPSRKSER
jgi:serine/threonine protein kinase